MSNYTDKILAKIQREQQIKEAKEAQLNEPLSMASSDDADMDFEFDNSVSDGEFAESFFNDDANGDEVKIDLDEPDEVEEEFDTLDELREKEIKDKKKKKGRLGELEEQELEEQGIAATSNTEPVYVFSEEIPADLAYEDAIPADISDGNSTHISVIDAVVQSETYEQQIVREQEEQERVITAVYDQEPSMELEMPQQQNRPEEISDVVSSVASSDVTEKFYSADEVSGMDEERKVLPVSNLADNMSDATEEQHTINAPHAVDEEKIINHVADMSDAAEEQHVMNTPDVTAESAAVSHVMSDAVREPQATDTSGAVVESVSHTVIVDDFLNNYTGEN